MNISIKIYLFTFILLSAFIFISCGDKVEKLPESEKYENTSKDTSAKEEKVLTEAGMEGRYFCPMHPDQQSDDVAAVCAVCGMKLSSKDEHTDNMNRMHDEIVHKHEKDKNMNHFEIELSPVKSDECIRLVEAALRQHNGVTDLFIDILEPRAHIMYDKSKTGKQDIEMAVVKAGFDANGKKADSNAKNSLPENCR